MQDGTSSLRQVLWYVGSAVLLCCCCVLCCCFVTVLSSRTRLVRLFDVQAANNLVSMTVKINQKVTKIQIEIRDNAGKVVSLNDNNTIVLRLDRAV